MAPVQPEARGRDGHDLPIGEMAGQEQHALAADFFRFLHIVHPDARIGSGKVEFVEMGIFGHRAAEIVPHGAR